MRWKCALVAAAALWGSAILPAGAAVYTSYSDSSVFAAAIGTSLTDNYQEFNTGTFTENYTNAQMDAVFGETQYIPTAFPVNGNEVGPFGGSPNHAFYCAGCNGSFILDFTHTTIGTSGGVYGVGFIYTDRSAPPFNAYITFGDGSTLNLVLSATSNLDVDFFGLTSAEDISSIAFGLADGGITDQGDFRISDLTIADPIPEPATLAIFGAALIVLGIVRRGKSHRRSE